VDSGTMVKRKEKDKRVMLQGYARFKVFRVSLLYFFKGSTKVSL
jgi:hypothetical protein